MKLLNKNVYWFVIKETIKVLNKFPRFTLNNTIFTYFGPSFTTLNLKSTMLNEILSS